MKPTSSSNLCNSTINTGNRARVLRRLAAASLKKMNPTEMSAREEPLRRTVLIRRTFEWVKQQQRQLDVQDVYDLPLDTMATNAYHDPMLTLPRYVEEDSTTSNTLLTPDAYDWSWLGDDRLLLTQIISTSPQQSSSTSTTTTSSSIPNEPSSSTSSSTTSIPVNNNNNNNNNTTSTTSTSTTPSLQQQDSLLSHTISPPTNEQDDDLNAILLWNYRQTLKRPCPDEDQVDQEQDLSSNNPFSSNNNPTSTKRVKTATNDEPPAGPAAASPVILSV